MIEWSAIEIGILARAISHAPSVHNTQPWVLETDTGTAELHERTTAALPRHDPAGRDRMISCGAAVANLHLAVRALGRDAAVSVFPDDRRPNLVARLETSTRQDTTAVEDERYTALFRRRSHRAPFRLDRVSAHELRLLTEIARDGGTWARVIDPRRESTGLAELLAHAGAVLREDRAYQRELAAWMPSVPEPGAARASLPWAGLVRSSTHLPDTVTLAERLAREGLLVLVTGDDTRRDQVRAGAAMQRVWLTAVARGLAASVLTQPLKLPEVRSDLVDQLGLAGFPQLILRVGYPVAPAAAPLRIPSTADYREDWR
ncbi:Acg family FMN-binding oxidoreductase [Amycolatopsis sp. CA-230715]|uniref:Acg family FMN-binding oxidoreductase n=1 Tax=Amycolatopsis sp. CA-230715 TaxID=2745196 RepID=UPI001C333780|nr:nitroreductase family protein [Amycolatopsis sp. CA-230715]QWF77980.1 Putative NAD(P)H nitroreductase [Amycolatopsis sp. CA-230715]